MVWPFGRNEYVTPRRRSECVARVVVVTSSQHRFVRDRGRHPERARLHPGEVALSFLGAGIQEPVASWGNMLQQAQNLRV